MKRTVRNSMIQVLAAMSMCAAAVTPQAQAQATKGYNHKIPEKIMTPDKVETRIGTLEFFDGMPTKATVEKVFDNLDLMRGVEEIGRAHV